MTKTSTQLIDLVRNITGRVDSSDPLFTNAIMLQYITDFIQLVSTQELRLYKNKTWWTFNLGTADTDPYPVNLVTLGYETIGPLAYAAGYEMFWYQDPGEFYAIWPETTTYTATRPTYVLYYNNTLTFRAPPDQTYAIKIQAYQVEPDLTGAGVLTDDYMFFYVGYGAALNIFAEYGETDQYNTYMPIFNRYKTLCNSRSWNQYVNTRTSPEF